jgi:hypothetical protein
MHVASTSSPTHSPDPKPWLLSGVAGWCNLRAPPVSTCHPPTISSPAPPSPASPSPCQPTVAHPHYPQHQHTSPWPAQPSPWGGGPGPRWLGPCSAWHSSQTRIDFLPPPKLFSTATWCCTCRARTWLSGAPRISGIRPGMAKLWLKEWGQVTGSNPTTHTPLSTSAPCCHLSTGQQGKGRAGAVRGHCALHETMGLA